MSSPEGDELRNRIAALEALLGAVASLAINHGLASADDLADAARHGMPLPGSGPSNALEALLVKALS